MVVEGATSVMEAVEAMWSGGAASGMMNGFRFRAGWSDHVGEDRRFWLVGPEAGGKQETRAGDNEGEWWRSSFDPGTQCSRGN